MKPIVILAHVSSAPVTQGFVPAARRLGFPVLLLTDRLEEQQDTFAGMPAELAPTEIRACDVFNPVSVIDATLTLTEAPAAIFSNSDHLQTATAIAASYHGLPGKDWKVALRAKSKGETRAWLAAQGVETVWHRVVTSPEQLPAELPLPVVVKPAKGVASEQVQLGTTRDGALAACHDIWRTRPGEPVLLEEFLEGPLVTLETLGDGKNLVVLGGFRTELSAPPAFIELQALWGHGVTAEQEARMLDIVRAAGVQFGSCHTEFILTASGPKLVEINYRTVGDHRELLLDEALGLRLFERILKLHLGAPLEVTRPAPAAVGIRYVLARQSGTLSAAPEAFRTQHGTVTVDFTPSRRVGSAIRLSASNRDYVGSIRGFGGTEAQLLAAFDETERSLEWGFTS